MSIGYDKFTNYASYQVAYTAYSTIILYLVAYQVLVNSKVKVSDLINAIRVLAITQGVMMALQYFGVWFLVIPLGQKPNFMHFIWLGQAKWCVIGFLSNTNMAGSLIAICAPAFFARKWWVWLLLLIPCLFFSLSQGGIIALAIGSFIYLLLKYKKYAKIASISLVIVTAIVMLPYLKTTSYGARMVANKACYSDYIAHKPILGYGIGQFKMKFDSGKYKELIGRKWIQAHNEYLQTWFELGIIGLLLSLGFIYSIIRKGKVNTIALIGVIVSLVNSGVNFLFHTVVCVVFLIYCVIIEKGEKDEKNNGISGNFLVNECL